MGCVVLGSIACCAPDSGAVPEGAVAVVGDVVLTPDDLASTHGQLGAYAQRRFRGIEGRRLLLEALVDAELLASEANEAGLGDDPRVEFQVLEELAALELTTELERRVPHEAVAADLAALRQAYQGDRDAFVRAEQRGMKGVAFRSLHEADVAIEQLRRGTARLETFGEVVTTPMLEQNDLEYPGFHRVLFHNDLQAGHLVPRPVLIGDVLLVGYVDRIIPPTRKSFDDPVVREALIEQVRAPRAATAREQFLRELEAEYPWQAKTDGRAGE